MVRFVETEVLDIKDEDTLNYVTDAILMSWQFYTSLMETLGRPLSRESAEEALQYTTNAMAPFRKIKKSN
jgi:hypothetical protein